MYADNGSTAGCFTSHNGKMYGVPLTDYSANAFANGDVFGFGTTPHRRGLRVVKCGKSNLSPFQNDCAGGNGGFTCNMAGEARPIGFGHLFGVRRLLQRCLCYLGAVFVRRWGVGMDITINELLDSSQVENESQ